MSSLYGRLFKYRERDNRAPKEDFLTEALVDLLNRMPRTVLLTLLREVLFINVSEGASKAKSGLLKELESVTALYAHSQYVTQKGKSAPRPDIVLADESENPLVVIENKIAAPFQYRRKKGPQKKTRRNGTQIRNFIRMENGLRLHPRGRIYAPSFCLPIKPNRKMASCRTTPNAGAMLHFERSVIGLPCKDGWQNSVKSIQILRRTGFLCHVS